MLLLDYRTVVSLICSVVLSSAFDLVMCLAGGRLLLLPWGNMGGREGKKYFDVICCGIRIQLGSPIASLWSGQLLDQPLVTVIRLVIKIER